MGKLLPFPSLNIIWCTWIRCQRCQLCVLWENSIGLKLVFTENFGNLRVMRKIILCKMRFNPCKIRLNIGKLEFWNFMSYLSFPVLGSDLTRIKSLVIWVQFELVWVKSHLVETVQWVIKVKFFTPWYFKNQTMTKINMLLWSSC